MPKIVSSSPTTRAASSSIPNVLKRNQACHQCRRRKLKCDAKRPCGTCLRSYKNARNHAPAGTEVPPLECTFDDPQDDIVPPINTVPKNRFERLESRINELETLLLKSQQGSGGDSGNSKPPPSQTLTPDSQKDNNGMFPSEIFAESATSLYTETTLNLPSTSTPSFSNAFSYNPRGPDVLIASHLPSPLPSATITAVPTPSPSQSNNSSPESHFLNQLFFPEWPRDLPQPELLHHLVDVFFAFHPHACRLFHRPSFMVSLMLPPTHNSFPHLSVLHAICAIGSFFTAAVSQPPIPNFDESPMDELFYSRQRRRECRPDSFGEMHAKFAKESAEDSISMGERLIESLQAIVILTWFYHNHARWADVFLSSGKALRACTPLGLNMCPPFHSIAKNLAAPSIVPPARTVIEDETRRNIFWLSYASERLHSTGNGWAMFLDDQDISQLLPVKRDQYDGGLLVPPSQRQWAHSSDLLLNHMPEQTDSFTLFVKSTILLSKVKNFNLRFRMKNYAGEKDMCPPPDPLGGKYVDPRHTKAFRDLDELVQSFHASFPRGLKDPINGDVVDNHLFTACLTPQIASIILHDPHSDLQNPDCVSAKIILRAVRSLLEYLYSLLSTSYDITLLDTFCCLAWFMGGRVLVRFLHAATQRGDQMQIPVFQSELEVIRMALDRMGVRLPIAFRYSHMLDSIIVKTVGPIATHRLPFSNRALVGFVGMCGTSPADSALFDS